ncbi:MAG: HEAT repeat protein [Myxococcota bacterium]|jgi:HEAT repeat protein
MRITDTAHVQANFDRQIANDLELLDRGRADERRAALTRLADSSDPRVTELVAERALDDVRSDWDVALLAEALGRLGGAQAVKALTQLLPTPARKKALDRLVDEPPSPRDSDHRAAARDQRYDDLHALRAAAAQALGKLGGDDAVAALVEALNDTHKSAPRRDALRALKQIGSPDALAAITKHKADRRAARASR